MSLPEGYLPREGDVVLIRAKIHSNVDPGDDVVFVSLRRHDCTGVPLDSIVELYARHWNVGDKVRVKSNGQFGEVAAICDDYVWVKHAPADPDDVKPWFKTAHANELEPDAPELEELIAQPAANAEAPDSSIEPPAPGANPDDEEIKF